ncbi:MAG: flagellar hook-associated protein FlgK [Rhodospirillaceae bacterium]|nr:flagellar hook-associated protein FlgK [Rhodospirillaceae bacterium]
MSGILDIALSGIQAYRQSLVVAGENLSNANTDGYHRRVAKLEELPSLSSGIESVGKKTGFGVRVVNVDRAFDEFLADDERRAQSNLSRYESYASGLQRLENMLMPMGQNLTTSLTDFFNSLQELTDDPASLASREIIIERGATLASVMQTTASHADSTKNQTSARAETYTRAINAISKEIANLNGQLRKQSGQNNSLLDQRDKLLNTLSEQMDFTAAYDQNGLVLIRMGLSGNGPILVDNTSYSNIGVTDTGERLEIIYQPGVANKGTQVLSGGKLRAEIDIYNEATNVLDELDTLSNLLTGKFNEIHTSGRTLDGNLGDKMFTNDTLATTKGKANRGNSSAELIFRDGNNLPKGDLRAQYISTVVSSQLANTSTIKGVMEVKNADLLQDGSYTVTYMGTDGLWEMTGPGIDNSVISTNQLGGPGFTFSLSGKAVVGDKFTIVPLSSQSGGYWRVEGDNLTNASEGVSNVTVDGLEIQFTGNPQAGDIFNFSPRSGSALSLEFNINDPRHIAASGDRLVYSNSANVSEANIFGGYVDETSYGNAPKINDSFGKDFKPFQITNSTQVNSALVIPRGTKDFSIASLYQQAAVTLEQNGLPTNGDQYDIVLNDGSGSLTIDAAAVSGVNAGGAQVSRLTLSGTIQVGNNFTVEINGTSFTRTVPGGAGSASAAATDLITAINASSLNTYVTASSGGTGVINLTAKTNGEGFTLASSASYSGGSPQIADTLVTPYTAVAGADAGVKAIYTAFQALSDTAKSGYTMNLDHGRLEVIRADGKDFEISLGAAGGGNTGNIKESITSNALTSTAVKTTNGVEATQFHIFNRDGIRLAGRNLDEANYNTLFDKVFTNDNGFVNEKPVYNGYKTGDQGYLGLNITSTNGTLTEDHQVEFRVGEFYDPLNADAFEKETVRVYDVTLNKMISSFNLADQTTYSLGGNKTYAFPSEYNYMGSTRAALAAAASPASNTTTASEDVVITGNGVSKTIDVLINNSAKDVAALINSETSNTGVTASAKTFAKLLSTSGSNQPNTVKINGISTGSFQMSNTNVTEGVTKINSISGTTGVTATASADGTFILLNHSLGEDITIENADAFRQNLDVYAVQYDGTTVSGGKIDLAQTGGNDSTRVMGTIKLSSQNAYSVAQSGSASTGYFVTGNSSVLVDESVVAGSIYRSTLDQPVVFPQGTANKQEIFSLGGEVPEDLIVVVENGGLRKLALDHDGFVTNKAWARRDLRIDVEGNKGSETATIFDSETETMLGVFNLNQSLLFDVQGWRIELDKIPSAGDKFYATNNPAGSGDNRNILKFIKLQDENLLGPGSGNFQEIFVSSVAKVGSNLVTAETTRDGAEAIRDAARSAQASFSGVDLDTEAADLIRFQQAYQASAQVLSSARLIFDTLLNTL